MDGVKPVAGSEAGAEGHLLSGLNRSQSNFPTS